MKRLLSVFFGLALCSLAYAQNIPGIFQPLMLGSSIPNECGGNINNTSIYVSVQAMATCTAVSPTAGGTVTINSQSLGSYDYTVKSGNQTVSAFSNSDWFTTTADSRSAWIVVNGNLTIDAGQTFIPSNRKLFVVIYVTGACAINGSVSMSLRGANHSAATGSNIPGATIRIATGTFSAVVNPEIPAAGAAGGVVGPNPGDNGANGQSGGGGTGSGAGQGAGAAGTSFSGGTAGGASSGAAAGAGGIDGGKGGDAGAGTSTGGAGNPGGAPSGGAAAATAGTGGTLLILCAGQLSGTGTVVAAGGIAILGASASGGASGGGSITMMYGTDTSSITPSAAGGGNGGGSGGAGGSGTARKLAF